MKPGDLVTFSPKNYSKHFSTNSYSIHDYNKLYMFLRITNHSANWAEIVSCNDGRIYTFLNDDLIIA